MSTAKPLKQTSSTSTKISQEAAEESFCWKKFLQANPFTASRIEAVPAWSFVFDNFSDAWDKLMIKQLKVEYLVEQNVKTDVGTFAKVFWIGTTTSYFGYLVKIVDEGYPEGKNEVPSQWMNFMKDCYKIGHCAELDSSCVLIPPIQIGRIEKDWKDFMVDRILGSLTIHPTLTEIYDAKKKMTLPIGTVIEIVDSQNFSKMKPGVVMDFKGSRVFVQNKDSAGRDGRWCDMSSSLVHAPGWSKTVGHEIESSMDYNPASLPEDTFPDIPIQVEVGMKLEAIHPGNPKLIAIATITKVLNYGFILVSFEEGAGVGSELNTFCFHITSPEIFYCGFCEEYKIKLLQPSGWTGWADYFSSNKASSPLPIRDLRPYKFDCESGFKKGSKLEAADLLCPSIIRVATVGEVKGRLLWIHFDGTSTGAGQWSDSLSPDLYPVGWCDTFEHFLTGPSRNSKYWLHYKHPKHHKTNEFLRRRGNLIRFTEEEKEPTSTQPKGGMKRKADSIMENALFNNEVLKADAIKLGSKPKVARRF